MSRGSFWYPARQKVVLFFGTPRKHKGLLQTAEAIATLKREDALFVIVGDFPDPALKASVQQVTGCQTRLIGNQPFKDIPQIVAMADCCVFLQDQGAGAQYQLPLQTRGCVGDEYPGAGPAGAPLYALTSGVFMAGLARALEVRFTGIALQSDAITLAVFGVMLVLYAGRWLCATPRFQLAVCAATARIALVYLLALLASLAGLPLAWLGEQSLGESAAVMKNGVLSAAVAALNKSL